MVIEPARLRERLRYDAETGKLYWRSHPGMPKCWNTRYANTEALASRTGAGYCSGSVDGVDLLAHRVVWAIVHGAWPACEIDHEDHDRANNRIGNLRDAGKTGNRRNHTRHRTSASGVMGVNWAKREGKWRARITVDNRDRHLGYFDNFEDAIAAREAALYKHNFHPNHGAASW